MGQYSFFFFKKKTAYEMRISDWISDVCSSDRGDMAKKVRNSDRPINTELGGEAPVPMALRSKPSTMMMRVNPVIIISMAGKKDIMVSRTSVCTLSDQVWLPF